MKICFLGTGAADWPSENPHDGKFFRRLSSLLVNSDLLIDPGPLVGDAVSEFNIDISKIKYIINTHPHGDHLSEKTLALLKEQGAQFIEFSDGEEKTVGSYKIKALRANHSIPCLHYLITDGEKKLFYGLDGAWLMYGEVQEIIKNAPVDCAVFDATMGFIDGDYRIFEHNNLNMVLEMKKTLSAHINRFCISHMARTLHKEHGDIVNDMSPFGVDVAYDGMTLEI